MMDYEAMKQATAPSLELDAEIARIVGWSGPFTAVFRAGTQYYWNDPNDNPADAPPAFSSSIDAALTLSGPDPLSLLMASIFFCQQDGGTVEDLPRYICAAALKARNPT